MSERADRVTANLQKYGLWQADQAHRIEAVAGDLGEPGLGLSEDLLARLAETCDAIYHNGAYVHFTYPYPQLKPANVDGTVELIRLATRGRTKAFHHISTIGIFFTEPYWQQEQVLEEELLTHQPQTVSGYVQSKWVAEKLVMAARDRGLPTTIHRFGFLSGDSQSGAANELDYISLLLKGYLELGAAPDHGGMMEVDPVDWVAQGIVHLSLREESLDKAFHLINPEPSTMARYGSLAQ